MGRMTTAVGIIGHGAIGRQVAEALRRGEVPGCRLAGVLTRTGMGVADHVPTIGALVEGSDLVVEAAGHAALAAHGPTVRAAGRDLYVVSVGALVDDDLRRQLLSAGTTGRLLISTGAIGGLDLLRAAIRCDGLDHVTVTTTKHPTVLQEPDWMDPRLLERLRRGQERVEVFTGSARDAARRFPRSVNVTATVALATIGLDQTQVRVIADPAAEVVEHIVEAQGDAGTYAFRIRNQPSPGNARTSAVTPHAVLRALGDRGAATIVGA